jgi:hypothetical protein
MLTALTELTFGDDDKIGRRPSDWPRNARAVTTRLTRHAPGLRRRGWFIDNDDGQNEDGVIKWTVSPPEKGRDSAPSNPSNPSNPSEQVSSPNGDGVDGEPFPGDNPSAPSDLSRETAATSADGLTGQTGQKYSPSLVGATFTPPTGRGRCEHCGWHIGTQGHRRNCPANPLEVTR